MSTARETAPPEHAYVHRFVVEHAHIDDLGHAGNVTWVKWVNEAAIAHSRSVGLTPSTYAELGVIWVVRRHEIEYFVPALQGETIAAITWVADLRGATSRRHTIFRRDPDNTVLVRALTTWALIDARSGRPHRIPTPLLQRYGFRTARSG